MSEPLPTLDFPAEPPAEDASFGALVGADGPLPLQALDVRAEVDGLVARTEVRQTFANASQRPLEATYIFPLPDRAAVTAFRLRVAGRVVEGDLQERAKAQEAYTKAVAAGHRAALAEEERPGTFSLKVGNLPPGEMASVELSLVGPLPFADGEVTYRFPLVVAPRYIAGRPLPGPAVGGGVAADTDAVPDASRISPPVLLPGFPSPVRLSLTVAVRAAGLAPTDFRSALHTVGEGETADGSRHFALRPGERLDRDFVLRWRLAGDAVSTSLAVCPDADGEGGTFLLTLIPPRSASRFQRPRDVAFLLDRSGSMGGWKMVAARRAIARMVETLSERDRLLVLAFDDRVETPDGRQELLAADDRWRTRTVGWLEATNARGGTELAAPMRLAVEQLNATANDDRDRLLVLVTDGQVGNEDQLLALLGDRLASIRVFTLGIDRAVNEGFLRRLAGLGGGSCDVVESEERLGEVTDKVHRRLGTPTLSALRPEPAGMAVAADSLTPARLPDLFAGTPLLAFGRYTGTPGPVALSGRDEAGRPWAVRLEPTPSANLALPALWARGRVRDLEDRYLTGTGNRAAIEAEVVQTSLRFKVLCRFTAFLAVDVKEVVNAGGAVERITQPVEFPSGWAVPERGDAVTLSGALPVASLQSILPRVRSATPFLSAAPPPAASRSFLGGMGGWLSRSRASVAPRLEASPPAKPPAPVDLSAYRRRAKELLDRMAAAGPGQDERLRELAVLAVRLRELLEDLRSAVGDHAEAKPLAGLAEALEKHTAAAAPGHDVLDGLWTQAGVVLAAFAGVKPGGGAVRRRWWA